MKNAAPMRSDSCAASSAELAVRKAWPWVLVETSSRNDGRRITPRRRISAPEAQESRMAMRTSAPASPIQLRSSWYETRSPPSSRPSSSEWPE